MAPVFKYSKIQAWLCLSRLCASLLSFISWIFHRHSSHLHHPLQLCVHMPSVFVSHCTLYCMFPTVFMTEVTAYLCTLCIWMTQVFASLSVTIEVREKMTEGQTPYEPSICLWCTEEVIKKEKNKHATVTPLAWFCFFVTKKIKYKVRVSKVPVAKFGAQFEENSNTFWILPNLWWSPQTSHIQSYASNSCLLVFSQATTEGVKV